MSVACKRIFSWEYATVLEGFIRRTHLWMKGEGNTIYALLAAKESVELGLLTRVGNRGSV